MNDFPALPKITIEPPGPVAKAVMERDRHYLSPSLSRPYPLVAEEARGAVIRDPDGNYFLDFAAGIAVVSTGHCHPKVVEAIREQAGREIHMSGADFYLSPVTDLAEILAGKMPGEKPKRVFFGNSGTEAVECALKLAKYHTGRKRFIAFQGGFHGRTTGALALTASKAIQKQRFFPLMDGVTHVPFANCLRCAYGKERGNCDLQCVKYIEDVVFTSIAPPEEVAALFFEPIQGEAGYVAPPPEFIRALRRLCDEHGILLVADEIQSGVGRTGKFLAVEHAGVVPDIVCLAKGIASGMPLSACIASEEIMNWPPGSHASTFGGNPVCCAAALATLELIDGGLMDNAEEQGQFIKNGLAKLMSKHEVIADVRGMGLMLGIEFVKDRSSLKPWPEMRNRILRECFKEGVLLLGCGVSTIRVCPPLVINREQASFFLDVFARCLERV